MRNEALSGRRPPWREIEVTLASLDERESLVPACHIRVSQTLSWVVPGDGLPQHAETAP